MSTTVSPSAVLEVIVRTAVEATGAACGWIVARDGDRLVVVASMAENPTPLGTEVGSTGSAAFCFASGEPAARRPAANDVSATGAGGYRGSPPSVLTVPCCDDLLGTVAVLELADRVDGGFTLDDIETVSLLAGVAGAAIAADPGPDREQFPSPAELSAELHQLFATDHRRYGVIARTVVALLSAG